VRDSLSSDPDGYSGDAVADASTFGDESFLFALEANDGTAFIHRLYLRVGRDVARLNVSTPSPSPSAALAQLAVAQVTCFQRGYCEGAEPVPALLEGLACPAATVEAGAVAKGEGVSQVGGDAGKSGRQPGPGVTEPVSATWEVEASDELGFSPAVAGSTLFVNGVHATFQARDVKSGAVLWCAQLDYASRTTAAAAGDLVFYQMPAGARSFLIAADVATGVERWRFATGAGAINPTIDGETLYLAGSDNAVSAIDLKTGKPRWRFEVDQRPEQLRVTFNPVAVVGGVVYATADATLYAIDATTGEERWRVVNPIPPASDSEAAIQATSFRQPVTDGEKVYVSARNNLLLAIDGKTGEEVWRYVTEAMDFADPALVGGAVIVGSSPQELDARTSMIIALDAETGAPRWEVGTTGHVAQPAVVDDTIYVGFGNDESGGVTAVSADDGAELWSVSLGSRTWSPVVVNGMVFAATEDGRVVALGE
jgi:outer membrane protein assembly factor BamB